MRSRLGPIGSRGQTRETNKGGIKGDKQGRQSASLSAVDESTPNSGQSLVPHFWKDSDRESHETDTRLAHPRPQGPLAPAYRADIHIAADREHPGPCSCAPLQRCGPGGTYSSTWNQNRGQIPTQMPAVVRSPRKAVGPLRWEFTRNLTHGRHIRVFH